jgi:hypothetical protein
MKYIIFTILIFTGFYSSNSNSQSCPTNSSPEYRCCVGGTCGTPEYVAANLISAGSFTAGCFGGTGSCHYQTNSGSLVNASCSIDTASDCGCDSGQTELLDLAGNVSGCVDNFDPPPPASCDPLLVDVSGQCGTAPDECSAAGGDLGFVNGNAVCIPSDYGDYVPEDGEGTDGNSCNGGGAPVWGGSDGLLAGFGCLTPPEPEPTDDDNDGDGVPNSEDQTPNGSGGSPSSTGGTRTNPDTGETESCNPFTDSDCTSNASNEGAGQCDPESQNYFSCITSGRSVDTSPTLTTTDSFWTPRYPNGMSGVLEGRQAQVENTAIVTWLNSWSFANAGSCPSFNIDMNLGFINFGSGQLFSSGMCYIWDILRAIFILTALFTARSLIFGG